MTPGHGDAWSAYWAAAATGPRGGCVPNALSAIDVVLERLWAEVVRKLRKNASVLDLATGDGTVLVKMRKARPDLKLTGVDSARTLPPAAGGIQLKPGVAVERMPFPDARFDLVSSQFGIEYGDVAAAVRETGRVLRPGGQICFVVHHASGPIVEHNRRRRLALLWTVDESGLLDRARAAARMSGLIRAPAADLFGGAVAEAGRRFAGQAVVAEFAQAVARALQMGRNLPPRFTQETLDEMETGARQEAERIAALEQAAMDAHSVQALQDLLGDSGISLGPVEELKVAGSDRAFAWLIRGRS